MASEGRVPGKDAFGHVRAAADDAQELAGEVQAAAHEVEAFLTQQVRENPYRTLLIAAGAGYVLGGGLASSLTREVVRLAFRAVGPSMLAGALMPRLAGDTQSPAAKKKGQAKSEGD